VILKVLQGTTYCTTAINKCFFKTISMLVSALADHLNVDVPDLTIAVTAPERMEQKATIDGIFALAYGAYTHLSPTPFMIASQLVKLETKKAEDITGGKIALGMILLRQQNQLGIPSWFC